MDGMNAGRDDTHETVVSRRKFLAAIAAAGGARAFATSTLAATQPAISQGPFQLSVLTDEISRDLARALEIAAKEFGVGYVDLRAMWGKSIVRLTDKEIADAKALVKSHGLKVGCIAGPLFKVDWPQAPRSKFSPRKTDFAFDDQDTVLQRQVQLAHEFDCPRIRCFDFFRLDDPAPYRAAMDERLARAAETAGRNGLTLVLENEHACNTATGAESARTLKAIDSPHFKLIWDPANAFFAGEKPFPDGYACVPKDRIGMVHCKDAVRGMGGKPGFEAMGRGEIDYAGQFRALARDGFSGLVTLETHWKGGGTPEESSRQSMKGLKTLVAGVSPTKQGDQ